MLRGRSRGVAKNSRHTKGQAMDFYLPGVPIRKIRDVGLRLQAGGVGYYPGSRSPFVHIDTGNVRHWPRMTRKQLAKVFPRGNTVHVPRDGKPFSGYKKAKAKVAARKAEMIRTTRAARRFTQVAKAAPARPISRTNTNNGSLIGRLTNASTEATTTTSAEETSINFPKRLARLPKPATNRPVEGSPAQTAADKIVAQAVIAEAQAAEAQKQANEQTALTEADNSLQTDTDNLEQVEQAAIDFTSLPRPNPSEAFKQPIQVADTTQAPDPAPQDAEDLAGQPTPDETDSQTAVAQTTETDQQDANPTRELAALPQVREQPQPASSPIATADAKTVLNQLAGNDTSNNAAIPAQSAYASAQASQVGEIALPTAAPRAQLTNDRSVPKPGLTTLPQKAERPRLARLPQDLKNRIGEHQEMMATLPRRTQTPSTQAKANLTAPAGSVKALAKLTFAYGPSGMAHFAHLKQSTRTATFARLSRPIPHRLNALVIKPQSMVEQRFVKGPPTAPRDTRFTGPAIVRMAVRNF